MGNAPQKRGEYAVVLKAANAAGKDSRRLSIVVGDKIGLTPQMGWNDWYTYYDRVTAQDIRAAAEAMVSSGMADYGYQYISIDDGWATKPGALDPLLNGAARGRDGAILPNGRFPNMAQLTASIHARGLKAGIYTSPGPTTCAKFEGSYGHELQDATQFARWGFDLLKYDWCSYDEVSGGRSLNQLKAPYIKMGSILRGLDRDIVFNLCQYGLGKVWEWGRDVGGNSWRTTDDVGVLGDTGLPGFYRGGLDNSSHNAFAGPGGWNDPDYILIGTVGNAKDPDLPPQATRLTLDEQYSYMSMWSLMAAPLFFTGDMGRLDNQTLNVLCNSEVIDVDQDVLGKQGKVIRRTETEFVLAKTLEDGSIAVGLFNLSKDHREITISWDELGIRGARSARDLWRQRDLGLHAASLSADVPSHGVMMVRIGKGRKALRPL
jgi:alpha-galactosidase